MKKIKLFDDLTRYLGDLKDMLPAEEEFLENKVLQYSVSMVMMNIINSCMDIGNEIISMKKLGYPDTYRDIFIILNKHKLISLPVANKLKSLVGVRNLLAHEYGEINMILLYEQASTMEPVEKFMQETINFFK